MIVRFTPRLRLAVALGLGMACATSAQAQTMNANAASYSTGYGRAPGQENRAVANYGLRDANGNLVVIDGVIQNGASSYSSSSAGASASASASGGFTGGVGGQASASAIGNNLTVVTQGDFNTVIINSTQINNGDVTAGATTTAGASNAQ